MDREAGKKRDWTWLPQHMPGVARLVAEKRRTLGHAHVNECWQRGVMEGQAGWFYAVEGPLSVGTPWDTDVVSLYQQLPDSPGKCMVFMRTQEQGATVHGA
jgi:hypothetical protein